MKWPKVRKVRLEKQGDTWFVVYLESAPMRPIAARSSDKTVEEMIAWVKSNPKLELVGEPTYSDN
jgi:hypothetical protein